MIAEESFNIKDFYRYKENNQLEIKKAQGGLPQSLWESYSSFANCYGGVIILGAAENPDGSIRTTGLSNERRLKKELFDTLNNPTKVSANLLLDENVVAYSVDGDVVLVIYVPRARREDRPVYINNNLFGGTYRRNWEGDYHCTQAEVKAMLRDQPEETQDMKIVEELSISDLREETVRAYRNRHIALKPGHVWEKLPDEEYLERIGAVKISSRDKRPHPTAAGLLMFGEEHKILYEYPEYFLDYREVLDPSIRWTDRALSSSGDWSGNLFDFFFMVYAKLTNGLKTPFKLEGITRIDDTPVHRAIREALANCLTNADFLLPRGVVIKKNQEEIIIENPGSIRTGKEQMLRGGITDPRNKALMKMFNIIGIGERAGSGVPDIFSVWEQQGWKEPVVEEEYNPDRTILKLSFVSKELKKENAAETKPAAAAAGRNNNDRVEMILRLLQDRQECTTQEIADYIGLQRARTRQILSKLVSEGAIRTSGNNRNRKYIAAESKI